MKKTLSWIFAATLLLTGCASQIPTPLSAPTQPPPKTPSLQTATATATFTPAPTQTATPRPLAERVLIISVDGLRADAVNRFDMPNTYALLESGAYALDAYTTYPSATLPSHASMLTGMCPEKHGVNWNDYLPENGYAASPSIFELAHNAGLQTVAVVGKEKLIQLTPPENLDVFDFINDRDSVVAKQAVLRINEGFDLMFVHLPLVDILGHEYGWMSPNYITGTYRADEAIGVLLATLDEASIRQGTLILVTSDHGGHDTTHGSRLPEDMQVPWIITGPSTTSTSVARKVSVVDTAATVAYVLQLPIPENWDGIPVTEAFGDPAPDRIERPCE
jgi:predicted AlkP superfamily pyrophosphatase or phosphodiesterase